MGFTIDTPASTLLSQRGAVLPLFVIGMLAILGMAGLALDMGHAYFDKTRLQNALDAAALSGAKVLDELEDTEEATAAALATFNLYAQDDLASLSPIVEFSDTLVPFNPGGTDPSFIRVRVENLSMTVWLAHVLPGVAATQTIRASAVAGPSPPLNSPVCDIGPLLVCADPNDTDCSDNECFGYPLGAEEETVLKTNSANSNDWEVGPGNFQLIQLDCGPGGSCVRDNLAGQYGGCLTGDTVTTKPGNTVGPVAQGFNTRFGIYQGGMSSAEYPPDLVTHHASGFWYSDYLERLENENWDYEPISEGGIGVPNRRIMAVPLGNCTGTTNGQGEVDVLGIGCFFLTQPTSHSGNTQTIYGQFVEDCKASGQITENPSSGLGGSAIVYKIILYKDPDSIDS